MHEIFIIIITAEKYWSPKSNNKPSKGNFFGNITKDLNISRNIGHLFKHRVKLSLFQENHEVGNISHNIT